MNSIPQTRNDVKIIRVSRFSPCPICEKPDWCGVFSDNSAAICMRLESERPTQNGGWLHFLKEAPSSWNRTLFTAPQRERALESILDRVYRELIHEFPLETKQKEALQARGLTEEEVQTLRNHGYVTLPEGLKRASVIHQLINDYGQKLLGVPGFYLTSKNRIWLAGQEGMLIPCRNVHGRIIGAQVRVSDQNESGKYRWLSATPKQRKRGGVSSGTPLHVAQVAHPCLAKPCLALRDVGRRETQERIWITEGILKADIAAMKLNQTVLGVAGVASWNSSELQKTLSVLKPKEIIIAFDADAEQNKAVRQHRMRLGKALLTMGYRVLMARWHSDLGKGLDDVLIAGHTPTIEPFHPAPDLKTLKASPKLLGKKRVRRSASLRENPAANRIESNPQESQPLLTDVERLRHEMSEDMQAFILNATGDARLYRVTQGAGKTFTVLEVAHRLWEAGEIRPLYAAPRHDLLAENLRFPWQHLHPRAPRPNVPIEEQPSLCHHWERANALGNKRWNVVGELCKRNCEIGTDIGGIQDCPYFLQYDTILPIATVQETLFIPFFCERLFQNQELRLLGTPKQALIIDEPSPEKFVETVNLTTTELTKAIARCRERELQKLLILLRTTAEEVLTTSEATKLLGREAMEAIISRAGGQEAFAKLLNQATSVDSEETDTVFVEIDSLVGDTAKAWQVVISGTSHFLPKSVASPVETNRMRVARWFAQAERLPTLSPTEGFNEIPLNFQSDLLCVLKRDFEKYQTGKPYNSALVITKTPLPTIRLNLRKEFAVPSDVPVLILDGQGDAELLSWLLKREITTWDTPLSSLALRAASQAANAEITQVLDGGYGITTLWNRKTEAPKPSFWRLWEKIVQPMVEANPSATLLVTWKVIADYLRALQLKGEIPTELAIEHYGNAEGTNAYENRADVILLGTPSVSPDEIVEMANALFVDDEPLNTEVIETWRDYAYEDADGSGYQALIRTYQDSRLEALQRIHREHELIQAAHRIRPLLSFAQRGARGKRIILLTNHPLEELPPTRLVTVEELALEWSGENWSVESKKPEANSQETKPSGERVSEKLVKAEPTRSCLARPDEEQITFEEAFEVAQRLMEEQGAVWQKSFQTALEQTFCTPTRKDEYSDDANRQSPRPLPCDSTRYRWLCRIAKKSYWNHSQVTINRNPRGGGATWIIAYHKGELDEEYVRTHYAEEWDIKPEDTIEIEPWALGPYWQALTEETPPRVKIVDWEWLPQQE